MTVENTVIKLKGLTKKYVFLQVSDIHVSYGLSDEPKDHLEMIRSQNDQWSPAGYSPEVTIDMLKDYIIDSEFDVDAVLIAGDGMNFYSPSNFELFSEKIKSLPTEVLYTPGNHEHWVITHGVENGETSAWEQMSSLMRGNSEFWVRDYGEFLIVGIDNSEHTISERQLSFLKEQLEIGLPIFLLVHVPFYSESLMKAIEKRWGGKEMYFVFENEDNPSDLTREFCRIIRDSESLVKAVFAGHIHTSDEGEFTPGKMQYISAPLHDLYVRKITIQPAV